MYIVQELQRELPGPIAPTGEGGDGLTASSQLTVHGLYCEC
jgi:hypothetical protein